MNAEQQSTKFSKAEVKDNKVPAAELTALEEQSTEKPVSSKLGAIVLPVFSSARSPKQGFSDHIREVSQMPTVFLHGEITDHKIKLSFPAGKNPQRRAYITLFSRIYHIWQLSGGATKGGTVGSPQDN